MDMTCPLYDLKDSKEIAASATGVCQGPHHLVARDHTRYAAIRDRDQKRLIRHRRQLQHAL
jgi:hypothetical protein